MQGPESKPDFLYTTGFGDNLNTDIKRYTDKWIVHYGFNITGPDRPIEHQWENGRFGDLAVILLENGQMHPDGPVFASSVRDDKAGVKIPWSIPAILPSMPSDFETPTKSQLSDGGEIDTQYVMYGFGKTSTWKPPCGFAYSFENADAER